jgi:transcriptional regulator with XRE-family HTH domain
MKCFECDKTIEIKKYKAFNYTGVNLSNIVLMNVEVEVCNACETKIPLLRNVKKLHNAIGVAIALQAVHISGADMRYLRRSAGFSVGDWAKRVGVAEAHYSRLESGDRSITAQVDKLARVNFLNALKQQDPQNVELARHLEAVLNLKMERRKDFVIAIDAEKPETPAKYLPHDSSLLVEPTTSFIEAKTLPFEPLAKVSIVRGYSLAMPAANQELAVCG